MLRHHPGVWLPPVKELHHFDGKSVLRRIRRDRCLQEIARSTLTGDFDRAGWYLRFLSPFGRSHEDYLALFPERGRYEICGEITPAYAALAEEKVDEIALLLPDLKVLFIMRNPIERVLSALSMMYSRKGGYDPAALDEAAIESFAARDEVMNRTRYARTIEVWSARFGTDQLGTFFYEDIVQRPMPLLEEVCVFLGISWEPSHFSDHVKEVVNRGSTQEIPSRVRKAVARLYLGEIQDLAALFPDSPAGAWLESAEAALGSD